MSWGEGERGREVKLAGGKESTDRCVASMNLSASAVTLETTSSSCIIMSAPVRYSKSGSVLDLEMRIMSL